MITQIKSEDCFYQGRIYRTTDRTSLLLKLATGFANWLKEREVRRRDRRAIQHLSQLSEKDLRDIGITPGAVNWAKTLPSEISATKELEKIARATTRSRRT